VANSPSYPAYRMHFGALRSLAFLTATLAGLTSSVLHAQYDTTSEAGRRLAESAAGTRAAFRRLAPCPPAPAVAPAVLAMWVTAGDIQLPREFRRDTVNLPQYMHGGVHYRDGRRVVKVIFGHYGWASFTGWYGGRGEVPGGCRAHVGTLEFLVSRRTEGRIHTASAIPILDTLEVRGDIRYEVTAPHAPLELLLQILTTRRAPAR
jgi:hypothetical protein